MVRALLGVTEPTTAATDAASRPDDVASAQAAMRALVLVDPASLDRAGPEFVASAPVVQPLQPESVPGAAEGALFDAEVR